MHSFTKVFKNVVVILRKGDVEEVIKTGFSINLNLEESTLELYREEGKLSRQGSFSRGFRRRIAYRGFPTIEGLYSLLALPVKDSRVSVLRKVEVNIEEEAFGVFTKELSFYQIVYDFSRGEIIKEDMLKGISSRISTLRPARNIEEFLNRLKELWIIIDRYEL